MLRATRLCITQSLAVVVPVHSVGMNEAAVPFSPLSCGAGKFFSPTFLIFFCNKMLEFMFLRLPRPCEAQTPLCMSQSNTPAI